MKVDRTGIDIPVYDLSVIRNLWEGRVKKYKQYQKKEQERINKSALAKINQQWQYRIICRKMKTNEVTALQCYLERSAFTEMGILPTVHTSIDSEEKKFIFELSGDKWKKLPEDLQYMTYLREWHIHKTQIQKLPEYIEQFVDLCILNLPKNRLTQLPAEIGKLANLKELNMNYNKLSSIPPELGECENLEKLEMAANLDLSELPFELSNLKKLKHLDLAENKFATIPVSVLRMSSLQWLDISKNSLRDLPEDIDRMEELQTLFLHKNKLKYLPMSTANIVTLRMLVVSGDELTCLPANLTENPNLKFIKLFDNPTSLDISEDKKDNTLEQTEHDKEFMQAYIDTLKDRGTPVYVLSRRAESRRTQEGNRSFSNCRTGTTWAASCRTFRQPEGLPRQGGTDATPSSDWRTQRGNPTTQATAEEDKRARFRPGSGREYRSVKTDSEVQARMRPPGSESRTYGGRRPGKTPAPPQESRLRHE
ncbi:leucine-rich repeat-containing protein 2 isoform X2 [Ictalurus punctatus]|uniref:Leucine-rich repeat-containing protein 2 isoform X2 n=1 Tax=Ictalurus punctatus TaxID=7998 RepID=A0A979EUL1_ICTPU|nr:leucine-rich repeat-containing protein 2 isoform X2 [Ictalurus punctatus]